MEQAKSQSKWRREREECTLEKVKQDILALGGALNKAEAVGIIGSLLREDFNDDSDIDLFIAMDDDTFHQQRGVDWIGYWHDIFKPALAKYRRDVDCIVYSMTGLKKVNNWYVLVVASDAVLVYDKGKVAPLFQRIIDAALKAGLVKKKRGVHTVWGLHKPKFGQLVKVEVEDDDEPS